MPADVILFAAVASINGLRNQEATLQGITPADPDFHRMRTLARQIQLSGAVRIEVKKQDGEELVSFMTFHTEKVPPEIQADIVELRRLLKLNPNATEYKVRFGAAHQRCGDCGHYALDPRRDANHGGGSRSALRRSGARVGISRL